MSKMARGNSVDLSRTKEYWAAISNPGKLTGMNPTLTLSYINISGKAELGNMGEKINKRD